MRKRGLASTGLVFCCLLFLILLLGGCDESPFESSPSLRLNTTYQAVFLDNGQVFFGKVEKLDRHYVTLVDVFYVQTVTVKGKDEKGKDAVQTRNMLIKRGNEWHGPDKMFINSNHVVLIEPVTSGSKVAGLISQAKSGGNASTAPQQQD